MCGLVAVISKYLNGFSQDQRDIFDTLLFVDTLRGNDSTGAFVVSNLGNVTLAKEASAATRYMNTPEYKSLRNDAFSNGWAMVGHNRNATRGAITDVNAHPFVIDDRIVLVHNGSYFGDHKKLKDTEVDSEAIAHSLAEEKDPELALRKVDAAYALIWYDVDNKTINMVRNSARPLWRMELAGSYVIASEEAFLQMVKYRYKYSPTNEPKEIEPYDMHSFKLNDDKSTTETIRKLDCSFWQHNKSETKATYSQNEYGGWGEYCGPYGHYDANVGRANHNNLALTCAHAANSSVLEVAIDTMKPDVINKFISAIQKDAVTMCFSDFSKTKEELKDQKIKVVINDVQEADDVPKSDNFILIGKTLINNHLYATFHVKEKTFAKVIESTNDSVFEIENNGISWRRTEPLDTKKPMEEWQGIAILHGKNPVPIYQGVSNDTVQ